MSMPTITGRTVKVGTKSFSAMEEELRQLHAEMAGPSAPPKGAFTAEQYAVANDLGVGAAYCLLSRRSQAGKLKRGNFRAARPNGHIRLVTYFWK